MFFRDTPEDRARSREAERAFVPPHCPNPGCPSAAGLEFRWKRCGWFERKRGPFRVQRFRCSCCGRRFSTQTFRYSYWQKRPDLDLPALRMTVGCAANRQIARALGCNKETVRRKVARGARHAIRKHELLLSQKKRPLEGEVLFDGLWSVEFDPNFPYELNIAVTKDDFVLGFTESELRRSGRLSAAQKRDRERAEARHGRPPRRSTRCAICELLLAIARHFDLSRVTFVSDEHQDYPRALLDAGLDAIPHKTVSSKAIRDASNPLYAVNTADLWMRHAQSNHKRETIAFSKRRQGGLDRAWVWLVFRNYVYARRIKRRDAPPAVQIGLLDHRLSAEEFFDRRVFDREVSLPPVWRRHIDRDVKTRPIPDGVRHELRYAY